MGTPTGTREQSTSETTVTLPPITDTNRITSSQPIEPKPSDGLPERHHCPHKPRGLIPKSDQPCTVTEYANRYHPHPIEATQSFKPKQQPHQGEGPMDDKTTHRVDYVPHPLGRPPLRQSEQYVQPDGDFDMMTTNKRDYTPKKGDLTKSSRKEYTRKSPGKFEGQPTYKNDFRQWDIPRTEKITHDPTYRPPSAPFEGDSRYHSDFIKHSLPPRLSMKPAETARQNEPFDGTTGYRDEYIKHALPRKDMKEKLKWEPNMAPMDGMSNYKKDYTPKEGTKTGTCKPDPKPYQSNAAFDSETTNRTDFQKWNADRPHVREPDHYTKPEGDIDFYTTTNTDYTKKPIDRSVAKKPEAQRKVLGKFEGTSNYVTDYRKWTPGERPKLMMKSEYNPPDAAFDGTSNYTTDFIKHPNMPRQSMRPMEQSKSNNDPFDGTTGYRDEYIKHPLEERQKKERPQWQPNPSQLEGLSNYRKDFTEKAPTKVASCKPDLGAYQSSAPFEDDTTQRRDYKGWQADRPFVHRPDAYVKPDGDFDHNTTTHRDYTPKAIERAIQKRPEAQKRIPGKFNGVTNYNEDFRKWNLNDRAMPKPKADYNPPDAPFEGNTNYHDDFIKHRACPTRSLKPADRGHGSDAPFDDGTEYRNEFTKKAVPDCPALVIARGGSAGYQFVDQDPAGHKWYAPATTTSITQLPTRVNNASFNKQPTALSVA